MNLSYKFGEIATYDSDPNVYYKNNITKCLFYKEENKAEFYRGETLEKTINDVKKIGWASGLCILTNSGDLYYFHPDNSTNSGDFVLNNVVDFAGSNPLYISQTFDIGFQSTLLILVMYEDKITLYMPYVSSSERMSLPMKFPYGSIACFIAGSAYFIATKNSLMITKDGTTIKTLNFPQALLPHDVGTIGYAIEENGVMKEKNERLVLLFAGSQEIALGVDLDELNANFDSLVDGRELDVEYDDVFKGNAITPISQRSLRPLGLGSGIFFNDESNRYIQSTYSLEKPPQVITITDSNGLEIGASLPHKFSVNVPITEIEFRGALYNSCYLIFYFSGLVQEQYLIAYKGTVPEFESVEIAGTTINVGERKSGFNIMGDFAIKINSIVSSPTLQGNFISKAGTTTPFTKIKFIDKNGNATELNDFNFATK